jgi:hypothetical protein
MRHLACSHWYIFNRYIAQPYLLYCKSNYSYPINHSGNLLKGASVFILNRYRLQQLIYTLRRLCMKYLYNALPYDISVFQRQKHYPEYNSNSTKRKLKSGNTLPLSNQVKTDNDQNIDFQYKYYRSSILYRFLYLKFITSIFIPALYVLPGHIEENTHCCRSYRRGKD